MKKHLEENREQYITLPEDTKRLMFALVGKLHYYEKMKERGEVTDLCKAFDDHYKSGERKGRREGRREGRRLGRRQGRQEGMTYGIYMMIRMGEKHGENVNELVNELKKCFSLEETEALKYISQYDNHQLEDMKINWQKMVAE